MRLKEFGVIDLPESGKLIGKATFTEYEKLKSELLDEGFETLGCDESFEEYYT